MEKQVKELCQCKECKEWEHPFLNAPHHTNTISNEDLIKVLEKVEKENQEMRKNIICIRIPYN